MAHEAHQHEHEEEGMNWGLIIASAIFLVIGLALDKLNMVCSSSHHLLYLCRGLCACRPARNA